MKKIFILLFICLTSICSAQTTEHMKFKGVPMEGTLQTFTNKLTKVSQVKIHKRDLT